MEERVHHPNHYTQGEIEVIDYIRDKLTPQQFIGYCLGNVLKYVSRYQHKGGKEDLSKAMVYLQWAVEYYPEEALQYAGEINEEEEDIDEIEP